MKYYSINHRNDWWYFLYQNWEITAKSRIGGFEWDWIRIPYWLTIIIQIITNK